MLPEMCGFCFQVFQIVLLVLRRDSWLNFPEKKMKKGILLCIYNMYGCNCIYNQTNQLSHIIQNTFYVDAILKGEKFRNRNISHIIFQGRLENKSGKLDHQLFLFCCPRVENLKISNFLLLMPKTHDTRSLGPHYWVYCWVGCDATT